MRGGPARGAVVNGFAYLADEAQIVSLVFAGSALMLLVVVAAAVVLRARLQRLFDRLPTAWRPWSAAAALALATAYLLHDEDLAARQWLWAAVGVVLAVASVGSDARARGGVLRASWAILTWQALVGAKLTILAVPSPTAVLEASRLLVFNFCQSLLFPVLALADRFDLPGVVPFLDRVVTDASGFASVALISTVSLVNLAVVRILAATLRPDGPLPDDAAPSGPRRRLVRWGLSAMLLGAVPVAVWSADGRVPSMRLSGLVLLAMMLAPVVLVQGLRGEGRRWAAAGVLQLGLGLVASADGFPDWFRLLGTVCAFSGAGIVLWRGAALVLVRPDGTFRTAWAAVFLLLWFPVPSVAWATFVLGCLDLLFDLGVLASRPPVLRLRRRLDVSRRALLWSVVASTPLLLWCGIVYVTALATTVPTTERAALGSPTAVLDEVPGDPWAATAAACAARGLRPCRALEVACAPERCGAGLRSLPYDRRALICFPDRHALGRPFAELCGWTPQWDADVGTMPRQFSLPWGVPADVVFPDQRLAIHCCPNEGARDGASP